MSPVALSSLLTAAFGASLVVAQSLSQYPSVPLSAKSFPHPTDLPYKVDTDNLVRGTQFGFNICNSTTENQDSLCQTSYFNNATDFCLWAPSKPNSTIADTEGEEVAWCTKPGHGTRLIPAGAITGLEFRKTPDYIQIVGFIDQTKINIADADYGGELDPHGADLRGNPLGGVMYSTSASTDGQPQQVKEWTNFMGGNAFCLKACPGNNAADNCQHIYDRIGCAYNAPNNAVDKVFKICDADNAAYPGVYTSGGQTLTYTQPAESLGAITSIPYTAVVPPSSNCQTLTSSLLFAGLPTVSTTKSSSSVKPTGTTSKAAGLSSSGSSGSPSPSQSSSTSDGTVLAITGATFLGVVFSALFLA